MDPDQDRVSRQKAVNFVILFYVITMNILFPFGWTTFLEWTVDEWSPEY